MNGTHLLTKRKRSTLYALTYLLSLAPGFPWSCCSNLDPDSTTLNGNIVRDKIVEKFVIKFVVKYAICKKTFFTGNENVEVTSGFPI